MKALINLSTISVSKAVRNNSLAADRTGLEVEELKYKHLAI